MPLSLESFNIYKIWQKINQTLKTGVGSMKLTIEETPAELE